MIFTQERPLSEARTLVAILDFNLSRLQFHKQKKNILQKCLLDKYLNSTVTDKNIKKGVLFSLSLEFLI